VGFARDTYSVRTCKTCEKYGYPELTQYFLVTQMISVYGNMHPKLVWARTKTLGRGE
jgi:hypothetical protein